MFLADTFHNIGSLGWGLVHSIPKIVRQPSLWPDRPRKSAIRRYLDNAYFRIFRHGICLGYNGMGLDLKGAPIRDVLINSDRRPKFEFWVKKQHKDWTTVVEDKYLLYLYLKAHGLPVVPVFAYIVNGAVYGDGVASVEELENMLLKRGRSFFLKATDDLGGKNVHKINIVDGEFVGRDLAFQDMLKKGRYIIQPVIVNHPDLRKFNASTLNTLRLNTCWNRDGDVELWDGGFIRIGHAGSSIDNFAAGGLAVGVNGDGTLREHGINHDANYNYRLYSEHPDSHICFTGCKVPRYFEAIAIVKRAQRLFPMIPSIGWDVCITEDGILLLEANWNWGIEEIEMINGYHAMNRWKEIYNTWRNK